jgi:hypothetical protein
MKRSTAVRQQWLEMVPVRSPTILALLITEVFSNGQTGQGHTSTSSWRLIHLTEHKSHLGLAVKLNDLCLLHFVVQVVALTRSLTDTSEDGETTMGFGDVVL